MDEKLQIEEEIKETPKPHRLRKAYDRIKRTKKRTFIYYFFGLVALIAIPITLVTLNQKQDLRQNASGSLYSVPTSS